MRPFARTYPLVDTHAHVNLEEFANDLEELLARSRRGVFPPIKGRPVNVEFARPFVSGIVCPAVDLATAERALEIAKEYDFVYAAAAVHPNHVAALNQGEWDAIKALVARETNREKGATGKLVAIGETGLDRFHDDAPFEDQIRFFLESIALARQTRLPIIIHSREANDDLDAILKDYYPCGSERDERAGVVHSFSGTPEQALEWVDRGFYLGFGGFATYENKKFAHIWEAARVAPIDRILLETDSPFLTPTPLRGKLERNEPLTTIFVAKRLATLREIDVDVVARAAKQNAERLFQLKKLPDAPEELDAEPRR